MKKIMSIIYYTKGDIVLSREHAEQVASGTKDAGGNNEHRLKRQAMNWKAWPQMLWIEGLNYVFDDSISDQTKNAFRDAAKQWESQTCINFTENPSGKIYMNVYLTGLPYPALKKMINIID
ncbi:hypothetical protein OSTOST_21362 [Ostertagia ostertagi]